MSDRRGAKAIGLVARGGIREVPSRTFIAEASSGGGAYEVTLWTADGAFTCTCAAGANGRRCYHVDAAKLLLAYEIRSLG